ncbi:hypothetical protein PybrP1_008770 [[Pythium] brassicae (nom. inval.)]|nr:hypothetical protein PybrP1_008770 [[Pythium] brassicae (nom. inval.)]
MSPLVLGNKPRARSTALIAIDANLASDNTRWEIMEANMTVDTSGCALVQILDKSALSLACQRSANGKLLAECTHVASAKDYGDAAHLTKLWSMFGKCSDAPCLLKPQLYSGAQFGFVHAMKF